MAAPALADLQLGLSRWCHYVLFRFLGEVCCWIGRNAPGTAFYGHASSPWTISPCNPCSGCEPRFRVADHDRTETVTADVVPVHEGRLIPDVSFPPSVDAPGTPPNERLGRRSPEVIPMEPPATRCTLTAVCWCAERRHREWWDRSTLSLASLAAAGHCSGSSLFGHRGSSLSHSPG